MATGPSRDLRLEDVLRRLRSPQAPEAWSEFLGLYSPLILKVVQIYEKDEDSVADCFVFICEHLCRQGFRRLKKFKPGGPARFETWLRSVVRNLCIDWHRKELGRPQLFNSIRRLSPVDQEIFRCSFRGGMRLEQTFRALKSRFPDLKEEAVHESAQRIREALSPRQWWLLATENPVVQSLNFKGEPGTALSCEPVETSANPEQLAQHEELYSKLSKGLKKLKSHQRLLLRLRFEEDLTLAEAGRALGYANPQKTDREIRAALARLKDLMGI